MTEHQVEQPDHDGGLFFIAILLEEPVDQRNRKTGQSAQTLGADFRHTAAVRDQPVQRQQLLSHCQQSSGRHRRLARQVANVTFSITGANWLPSTRTTPEPDIFLAIV